MIEAVATKNSGGAKRGDRKRGTTATAAIGTVVLAVVLAACGSSTAKPAAGSATTSTTAAPTTTSAAPTAAPVVMTATNAALGSLLVDSSGKTLYTLTNAAGSPVACTGKCLTFWPPLLLPAGTTTATGAAGVTGLATVTAGGGMQVTDNGAPLYRFAGDTAAGDAHGEGIGSFGGTWHVVKASAAPGPTVAPSPTSPPTTAQTTTTTAGGYHY